MRRESAFRRRIVRGEVRPGCARARRRFRKYRLLIALALFAITVPFVRPQASQPSAPAEPAVVKTFRLMQEPTGPAVEILSTKPLVPAIRYIENPPRVVIDLPNTVLAARPRKLNIQADEITTVRGYQFQSNPAQTRIVVNLLARRNYTWEAAGNRLVVHLGKNPSAPNQTPFQPPTVVSVTPSLTPTPAVASVRTSGPLAIAQNSLSPGAAVTAGKETAVLDLTRGGEVYVCPGTSVTVTPSPNGHNILIGMNRGAMETHFTLDASSDSIMTPDFRIVFPGPGEFHYAVSADSQGNTCVRALPGNTASAIVSEMMGDRTYQVKATDQLVFRMGRLDQVDRSVPRDCGCPQPPKQPTVQVAKVVPEASVTLPTKPAPNVESTGNEKAALPAVDGNSEAPSNDLHVEVSAPLVFRASGPPPAPVEDVGALPLDSRALSVPPVSAAPPPAELQAQRPSVQQPSAKAASQRGFFGKVRGFFAAMFR